MVGYIVAIAVSAVVLFLVWYRSRRILTQDSVPAAPDRSLVGEAATAYEDIAQEVIGPSGGRHADGHEAGNANHLKN